VKIVSVINPRYLYRPGDVAWDSCSESEANFTSDNKFAELFAGDALIGVTGGALGMLEPIMLRNNCRWDVFAWKRGETTASDSELMACNGLNATALAKRAIELVH
jgi:phosphoketolase